MNLIDSMEIFVRVAELASFTRAAEALGLPKASISTSVQQLETSIGTQLLHRTTRRVELTQDGRAFYERCKDLLADVDELQGMFQGGSQPLRGRLRVDMPGRLALKAVVPGLPAWLEAHPELELELSFTDRRVDPVREGFDCVLRIGTLEDSSLVARPLGALRIGNYASPHYLEKHGVPRSVEDLAHHQLVHYVATLGTRPAGFEYLDGDTYRTVPMRGVVTVNNTDAYQAMCLAGLGLIQAPMLGVRDMVASGALVEVLPLLVAEPMPVSLVYPHRRNLPHRVKAFIAFVEEAVRPLLD